MKEFRADLHMHTKHSMDSLAEPSSVVDAAVKQGLSAIAITDHNQIGGAHEAAAYAKKKRLALQIIIGEEVSTDKGDLLVYFVKKRIPPGKLADVLVEVKKQGAICSSAHPYDTIRHGIRLESLPASLLAQIDCVEAFNARITVPSHNSQARSFALKHGKPLLAGSDAHHPFEIAQAHVVFEGIKKLDKRSLLTARRTIAGRLSLPLVHFYSRYSVLKKRLFRRA